MLKYLRYIMVGAMVVLGLSFASFAAAQLADSVHTMSLEMPIQAMSLPDIVNLGINGLNALFAAASFLLSYLIYRGGNDRGGAC
jgi:hypothetical protein